MQAFLNIKETAWDRIRASKGMTKKEVNVWSLIKGKTEDKTLPSFKNMIIFNEYDNCSEKTSSYFIQNCVTGFYMARPTQTNPPCHSLAWIHIWGSVNPLRQTWRHTCQCDSPLDDLLSPLAWQGASSQDLNREKRNVLKLGWKILRHV